MTMTTELNSFPKYSKISSTPSYYTAQPNLTNLSITSKLNRAARIWKRTWKCEMEGNAEEISMANSSSQECYRCIEHLRREDVSWRINVLVATLYLIHHSEQHGNTKLTSWDSPFKKIHYLRTSWMILHIMVQRLLSSAWGAPFCWYLLGSEGL